MQLPPVTGVQARYLGPAVSTGFQQQWFYWVQAVYPAGKAALSAAGSTGTTAAATLTPYAFNQIQWNPAPGAIGYNVYRTLNSTAPVEGTNLVFIATSETGFKDDGSYPLITGAPKYDGIYMARCLYNFAVDGGAIGAIIPSISDTIPANAIVWGGICNPTTAPVGAGATVAIGTSAGSSATSIMLATAITALTIDAVIELLGINSQHAGGPATDPTALVIHQAPFKMTAAGKLQLTVASDALTAGVVEVMVFYNLPTNP
jgi:hypothetical protein